MYTPRLQPKGKKTKTILKKERIHRDSSLTINNRSGLPSKLPLYDYYWDNILCYYTYDYAPGIMQFFFEQKTRFCSTCHDTKRERLTPPPAESGGAKVGHVHVTACREVDLSSCYLEDGSKPGLNQASRSQNRCDDWVYIFTHVFLIHVFTTTASSSSSSPTTNASRRSTVCIHIVTAAATPYNSYGRANPTTNSMRQHQQHDKQRAEPMEYA